MSQLRALVWLTWQDVAREGVDPTTGARATPLRHLGFSMGLIGVLTGFGAARHPDFASFAVQLAATSVWLCALVVMPDPMDVREKKLELIRSRPIPPRVLLQARLVSLLVVSTLVIGFVATPAALMAARRFHAPVAQVAGLLAALGAAGFAAVLTWLSIAFLLARLLGIARVRWFSQMVLMTSLAGVMAAATLLPGRMAGAAMHPVVRALPSTWFARLPFDPSPREWWACAAIVASAVLLHLFVDADRSYDGAHVVGPAARLGILPRLASALGRRVLPASAAAVADLVLLVNAREEMSRVRAFAPRLVQLGAAAAALLGPDGILPGAVLGAYGLMCVGEGVAAASRSAHPQAAQLLLSAPLAPRRMLAGLAWAVLAREALVPGLLLMLVLAWSRSWAAAVVLLAAFGIASCAVTALLVAVAPRVPLAAEQRAWPGLSSFLGTNLLGIACAVGFATLMALARAGLFGLVLAGLALVPLALATALLAYVASRRTLRSVE